MDGGSKVVRCDERFARVGFCAGEQKMWWVDLGLSVRLEGLIE